MYFFTSGTRKEEKQIQIQNINGQKFQILERGIKLYLKQNKQPFLCTSFENGVIIAFGIGSTNEVDIFYF